MATRGMLVTGDFSTGRESGYGWMGHWNLPHGETLTLIFPNSFMALIPC